MFIQSDNARLRSHIYDGAGDIIVDHIFAYSLSHEKAGGQVDIDRPVPVIRTYNLGIFQRHNADSP